jgi:chorismate mutase / prephenate dehydratase
MADLRHRIDGLDDQILSLLSERAAVALKIGAIKKAHGLPVRVPQREEEVIRRLQKTNTGLLPPAAVASIWAQIMAEMRALESRR